MAEIDIGLTAAVRDLGDWSLKPQVHPAIPGLFGTENAVNDVAPGGVSAPIEALLSSSFDDDPERFRFVGVSLFVVTRGETSQVVFERFQLSVAGIDGTDFIGGRWSDAAIFSGDTKVKVHEFGGRHDTMGLPGDLTVGALLNGLRLVIQAANVSSKSARTAYLLDVKAILHLERTEQVNDSLPEPSLLPQNATAQERAIERTITRDVPIAVRSVWNPDTCPAHVLPWLAWALSVDQWQPDWPEDQKRDVIRTAIAVQRKKGTAGAVREALGALAIDARVVEWHRQQVPGAPYTYRLFVEAAPDAPVASLGELKRALATVDRVKSLRSHLEDVQVSTCATGGPLVAAASGVGHEIVVLYDGQII